MVFARLGEYGTASQILDEAEPNDQTLAFTMFLMGHVEFEIGNFEKAEDSLKVALHSLKGSTQQFYAFGLDYILRSSHIQQSLRILESKNELVGMLGTLGALPADGVFEVPSRPRGYATAVSRPPTLNSRNSMDSGVLPALTEDRSSPSAPASPIESVKSLEYGGEGMQWHGLPENPDVHVTMPTQTSKAAPVDLSSAGETPSVFNKRASFAPLTNTLRTARKSAFEPREARVQGDSVRGLADFIRTLPSRGKKQQPKEARIQEDPTTMSLAEFFRTSGPGEANTQVAADNASEGSVYSDDGDKADSVGSLDLRNLVEDQEYPVQHRATPPPPSRHPYRSGFGSMLLQENMPSATRKTRDDDALSSDDLHDLLCDENASMDWPLTDAASRSMRESIISSASSRTELPLPQTPMNRRAEVPAPLRPRNDTRAMPPAIPTRTSSLLRRQAARGSRAEGERPISTVSSSRFFSHVANLR